MTSWDWPEEKEIDFDPQTCGETPGYIYTGRRNRYGAPKTFIRNQNLGYNCQQFSPEEFRKTKWGPKWNHVSDDKLLQALGYKWYGTSPICDASECDAYLDNKIPINRHNAGDGELCLSGKKILGVNPANDEERGYIESMQEKCKSYNLIKSSNNWKFLSDLSGAMAEGAASKDKSALASYTDKDTKNLAKEMSGTDDILRDQKARKLDIEVDIHNLNKKIYGGRDNIPRYNQLPYSDEWTYNNRQKGKDWTRYYPFTDSNKQKMKDDKKRGNVFCEKDDDCYSDDECTLNICRRKPGK